MLFDVTGCAFVSRSAVYHHYSWIISFCNWMDGWKTRERESEAMISSLRFSIEFLIYWTCPFSIIFSFLLVVIVVGERHPWRTSWIEMNNWSDEEKGKNVGESHENFKNYCCANSLPFQKRVPWWWWLNECEKNDDREFVRDRVFSWWRKLNCSLTYMLASLFTKVLVHHLFGEKEREKRRLWIIYDFKCLKTLFSS